MKDLGANQRGVLDSLRDHGQYPGGGWVWGNHSTTVKILDSLVKRGLVATDAVTPSRGDVFTRYTLSPEVRAALTDPWTGWDLVIETLKSKENADGQR